MITLIAVYVIALYLISLDISEPRPSLLLKYLSGIILIIIDNSYVVPFSGLHTLIAL